MSLYHLKRNPVLGLVYAAQRRNLARSRPTAVAPIYPFPQHANPTPYEVLSLPLDATASEAKRRYLELTKIYHPDTSTAQEMPRDVADARFHAITAAYNALQQSNRPPGDSNMPSLELEAEEIRKRLANWSAVGSRQSPLDKARRERALDAEKNAGKWWKADVTLYYVVAGMAIAVGVMQFQGRSTSVQKERVRKYLELRQKPESPHPPQREA